MASIAADEPRYTHWSQRQPANSLDHIPGDDGWPVVGTTFKQLADRSGSTAGCAKPMARSSG